MTSRWPAACTSRAVRSGIGGLLVRAGLALLLAFSFGCTKAPSTQFNLESVQVTGNEALDDDEIEERIASRETPRFLGLFPGVIYDYETFNRFVLERDLQRIERLYQARGYYKARARAAHVFRSGSKVRVEIVVEEGKPVLLRRVDVHGIERLSPELRQRAKTAVTAELPLDEPFEEEKLGAAAKALARELGDSGYAMAKVRKSADVNLPDDVAAVGFWVDAGERCELGEVTLEGLQDLPEARVRSALGLEPGDEYSQSEIDEAKRALLDLGVFSSVEIEPQVEQATPGPRGVPRVPLRVKLEKAKLRSIYAGGGVLVDSLRTELHVKLGWEDQSFMGGLRKLQFEVVPGVELYPTRFPTFQAPERLLPKGRFSTEFRQPAFITGRTNLVLKGQVGAGPAQLTPDYDPEAPIIGYFDYRASIGLERTLKRFYGMLSQNVQISDPFAYAGELDERLGRILISYPAFLGSFDLRDDRIHPHRGLYVQNELQVAGLGGDARDVKVQPELRAYLPLTRRATLAARGTIGVLFAQNYGDTIESNALTGIPSPDVAPDTTPWVRDIQIMFLRGFFSGGAGSNRGYSAREIGPHGIVPFYNHGQSSESVDERCAAGSDTYEPAV